MRIGVIVTWLAATAAGVVVGETSYAAFQHSMHVSMAQMHNSMDGTRGTGDPDRDFALMMIPHHQGAIDMAKVELLYGKDPVMRGLAQEIIADQQSEIEVMQLRLARSAEKAKVEK